MAEIPKVCIITAARSEYGLLRWLIDEIHQDPDLTLQLVVTGSHLSEKYGNTVSEIEADGYPIAARVDMQLSTVTEVALAKSMARCAAGIADAFSELRPDIVVVLGDRYELLPICSTALVMNIPIAHISGGDVTEGAIDDQVRNAVSMLTTLHFPGVPDSAQNLQRMFNSDKNIVVAGEPGLENFRRLSLLTREELAKSLNLDASKKWILVTQHSETKENPATNLKMASGIIESLNDIPDIEVVITKANADFGGEAINDYFASVVARNPQQYKLFSSLGQLRYLSFMREAYCIIGNSSSGIVEAPYLAKPVINIGQRQTGRHFAPNVITVPGTGNSVAEAFRTVASAEFRNSLVPDYHFGDGNSSEIIKLKIKSFLETACRK